MKPSLYVLSVISAVFIFGAIAPFTPSLESLTIEKAYVHEINELPGNKTKATFVTSQGLRLSCVRGYKGALRCPTIPLKEALDQHTQLTVWHDGATVYQAASDSYLIIDYSKGYSWDRWLSALAAIAFSLPIWIFLGGRIGLINKA
jgi:hypothetical protein